MCVAFCLNIDDPICCLCKTVGTAWKLNFLTGIFQTVVYDVRLYNNHRCHHRESIGLHLCCVVLNAFSVHINFEHPEKAFLSI